MTKDWAWLDNLHHKLIWQHHLSLDEGQKLFHCIKEMREALEALETLTKYETNIRVRDILITHTLSRCAKGDFGEEG